MDPLYLRSFYHEVRVNYKLILVSSPSTFSEKRIKRIGHWTHISKNVSRVYEATIRFGLNITIATARLFQEESIILLRNKYSKNYFDTLKKWNNGLSVHPRPFCVFFNAERYFMRMKSLRKSEFHYYDCYENISI